MQIPEMIMINNTSHYQIFDIFTYKIKVIGEVFTLTDQYIVYAQSLLDT